MQDIVQIDPVDLPTEEMVHTTIKAYFYKYVATLVVTLLLTFGASILSSQRSYVQLEDAVKNNAAAIAELKSTRDRSVAREQQLYDKIHELSLSVATLTAEVTSLRRDLSRNVR